MNKVITIHKHLSHTEIDYTISILPILEDSLTNAHSWIATSVPQDIHRPAGSSDSDQ